MGRLVSQRSISLSRNLARGRSTGALVTVDSAHKSARDVFVLGRMSVIISHGLPLAGAASCHYAQRMGFLAQNNPQISPRSLTFFYATYTTDTCTQPLPPFPYALPT